MNQASSSHSPRPPLQVDLTAPSVVPGSQTGSPLQYQITFDASLLSFEDMFVLPPTKSRSEADCLSLDEVHSIN